jgi:hypothetical protein
MNTPRLTFRLRPLFDGAYTQISLQGPVATVPQPREVRRLMSLLWLWHGRPLHVVLCADGTNAGGCWLEIWEDVLGRVPGRHLDIRYLRLHDTLAQGAGHER